MSNADVVAGAWSNLLSGKLHEAERICRDLLAADSRQADALHILGMTALRAGHAEAGLDLLQRSLQEAPDNPEFLSNIADVQRNLGRIDDALANCRKALALRPNHANALNNLGAALLDAGKPADAVAPLSRSVQIKPDSAAAQYNLGRACLETRQYPEAVLSLQRAIELEPKLAIAYVKVSQALLELNRTREAADSARAAIELSPRDAQAHQLLAMAQANLGRNDEATTLFQRAMELDPNDAILWSNLGVFHFNADRLDESRSCFEHSIALKPDHAEAHFDLAMVLLLQGDYARGWREYEWRWRSHYSRSPDPGFRQPLWDGNLRPDATILLHCEQGFGDSIQFARFIPLVPPRIGRVLLDAVPALYPLFRQFRVDEVVRRRDPLPDFDLHCPLMSLPLALGITPATIPTTVPYLTAPPDLVAQWRDRLASDRSFRVGLVWASGKVSNHPFRAVQLRQMALLADVPGVTFYSLQVGDETQQLVESDLGIRPIDLSAELTDFAVTAAVIENLDLVITVDTAVAHLSGALGRPTWTLLSRHRNWRWPLDKASTPWYPTMRLFWQKMHGDWNEPLQRVRAALAAEVG